MTQWAFIFGVLLLVATMAAWLYHKSNHSNQTSTPLGSRHFRLMVELLSTTVMEPHLEQFIARRQQLGRISS